MKKVVVLITLCCLSSALIGCSGTNSILVYVSPAVVTVNEGATLQFSSNVPVTWTVSGDGSINSAGFFTAGNSAQTVTVTATSADASRSTGIATVTVVAPGTVTTTSSSSPSGIAHRVFVSNNYGGTSGVLNGVLNIINADTDQISANTVTVGGTPTFMLQTSDQTFEVVYDNSSNRFNQVTNSSETVTDRVSLPGPVAGPTSAAVVPGATAVYAAVPSATAPLSSVPGAVYSGNFATGGLLSVSVAGARYLAMDHNAVNMLVFSQNSDSVTWVTNSTGTLTSVTGTLNAAVVSGTNCTFSRPVAAVFSDDDTTAYVLSSGPANGGTQAMVTVLNMTTSPPTCPQSPLNVAAANVGLLPDVSSGVSGTQLYVAGALQAPYMSCTASATQTCQLALTAIDTGTNPISISNTATFNQIASSGPAPNLAPNVLTFDGTNLWIGSKGCQVSVNPQQSCLAIYFPASGTAQANSPVPCVQNNGACNYLTDQTDDVTAMVWLKPFNGRSVMYVIEGGRLIAYFAPAVIPLNAVSPLSTNFNVAGTLIDAKAAH